MSNERTRFSAGNVPWNKGLKGYAPEPFVANQFKPGQHSHRWVPIGTERFSTRDGILERKVADTGDRRADWRPVHRLNWEEAYGPIPDGFTLVFRDRDHSNVLIDNLELISRAELMARNSMHRLPPELREVIHLKCRLTRKINDHDR
jgi:hypothetical protein